jgi:integrase/recombinase XerD
MKWHFWITFYIRTHCVARGLRATTMAAYAASLRQFQAYVEIRLEAKEPDALTPRELLDYFEHLRTERGNSDGAVNRHLVILKNFYRAAVAMDQLAATANPLAYFPKFKAAPRKLPQTLSQPEVKRLLQAPSGPRLLAVRDRAILALLYGTGIRASECASLKDDDVDLNQNQVTVTGKGGHQRTLPLNDMVRRALLQYRVRRGPVAKEATFFRSRKRRPLSRGAIFQRVRKWAAAARLEKAVSPHQLRHSCATHLVKVGVKLTVIRDLLGHRLLTSTQLYLHVSAEDLRDAAQRHPIQHLGLVIEQLLPEEQQLAPQRRNTS